MFFLGATTIQAQSLTMAQLLEVRKKDVGDVEDYLTARGWEFYEATAPSFPTLGQVLFTYNKDDISSFADSFLMFMYSDHSGIKRIEIQVHKKEKYTEYINAIKAYGCKLISSKVVDGALIKVYRGVTTTFVIQSSTGENAFYEKSAVWNFNILSNNDYDRNFSEDE